MWENIGVVRGIEDNIINIEGDDSIGNKITENTYRRSIQNNQISQESVILKFFFISQPVFALFAQFA